MGGKIIIISWDAVKEVGWTFKDKGGECSIASRKIPENCAVVFVDMLEWRNARRQAKV